MCRFSHCRQRNYPNKLSKRSTGDILLSTGNKCRSYTDEAESKGYKIKVGKFPLIANSKAIIDGEYEDGFVKIIADDKYGEILGAHAVGPNVGELMWGISLTTILEGTA